MKIALVIAAVAALAPAAASAESCFRVHDIAATRKVDNQTLNLRVHVNEFYRLTTKGSCLSSHTPSDPLVLKTAGASDQVCKPLDLDLGVKVGSTGVSHCIVDSIVKLTPEEVAALPKGQKP
jgi:hypothetical protein